jgi:hypothetical protein
MGANLRVGTDYNDIQNLDGACGLGITYWYWPLKTPGNAGVYAYDFMSDGQYDGGVPQKPVTPQQVATIQSLSLEYQLSYTNWLTQYNGLGETFLRSDPNDPNSKQIEVGFFTHTASSTNQWIQADKQLGTFVDSYGVAWQVVQHPGPTNTFPYVTLSNPTFGDRASGTLDFLGAIKWLQGKGLVNPSWWYTGLALGVEPITGSGWQRTLKFNVTYN